MDYRCLSELTLGHPAPDAFVAEDLLFYESPKHKVLGRPVVCSRNARIKVLIEGGVTRRFLEAWAEGHDEAASRTRSELHCIQAGDEAAIRSGSTWPIDILARKAFDGRKGLKNPVVNDAWIRHSLDIPQTGGFVPVASFDNGVIVPLGHQPTPG